MSKAQPLTGSPLLCCTTYCACYSFSMSLCMHAIQNDTEPDQQKVLIICKSCQQSMLTSLRPNACLSFSICSCLRCAVAWVSLLSLHSTYTIWKHYVSFHQKQYTNYMFATCQTRQALTAAAAAGTWGSSGCMAHCLDQQGHIAVSAVRGCCFKPNLQISIRLTCHRLPMFQLPMQP